MLKNNLKSAVRSLLKNKSYSAINILGLSLGLIAFMLIFYYVSFERSFDAFHQDADRIYRVTTDNINNGTLGVRDAMSFFPQGKALKEDYAEVEMYTTTFKWFGTFDVKIDDVVYPERPVLAVDEHFLEMFNYPIIKGTPEGQLKEPNTVVLTSALAEKYFPGQDPIGKLINNPQAVSQPLKVTGVVEDVPLNTHYRFDMLISIATIAERTERDAWRGFNYYTFIKLKEGVSRDDFQAKMPGFVEKYLNEGTTLVPYVQPLLDIHLYSNFTFEPTVHGNAQTVGFMSMISYAILIIAWVNYINLSTARSVDRAKEVGMRKVVGASKYHLIVQFLSEAMLINLIAIGLAMTLVQLVFPGFLHLISLGNGPRLFSIPNMGWIILGLFVISTFAAGFYPALVLSAFKPSNVLKGQFRNSKAGVWMLKSLVIFQFCTSLVLIAGTLIVSEQIDFMKSQDIGVDLERVVSLEQPKFNREDRERGRAQVLTFNEKLRGLSGVNQVASTSTSPDGGETQAGSFSGGATIIGSDYYADNTLYGWWVDDHLFGALGIDVLHGRNFIRGMAQDSSSIMINESMAKVLNLADPGEAVGEKFRIGRNVENDIWTIVGVVNDFNRQDLKHAVEPTVFFFVEDRGAGETIVKIAPDNIEATMASIEGMYQEVFPNAPFQYRFLDERFERAYKDDQLFGTMFSLFAGMAIVIACLGLLGLSSFLAIQKTKEIGVRKVLGASVQHIIVFLYKNFFWLLLVSVLVAIPVIWLTMEQWLSGYTYRIQVPLWTIVASAGLLFLISFLTVGIQTAKAALANPTESLRTE